MQYTKLGRSNMNVSKICLGTMHFGTLTPDDEAFRIMDKADRIVSMKLGQIENNIVVAERKFIHDGLRKCAPLAALVADELYQIADRIAIGLRPDQPAGPTRRPDTNRRRAARALVDRERAALRPRRHLHRRRLPHPHPLRPPDHDLPAQARDRRSPHQRHHQHRLSTTTSRMGPPPAHHSPHDLLNC